MLGLPFPHTAAPTPISNVLAGDALSSYQPSDVRHRLLWLHSVRLLVGFTRGRLLQPGLPTEILLVFDTAVDTKIPYDGRFCEDFRIQFAQVYGLPEGVDSAGPRAPEFGWFVAVFTEWHGISLAGRDDGPKVRHGVVHLGECCSVEVNRDSPRRRDREVEFDGVLEAA